MQVLANELHLLEGHTLHFFLLALRQFFLAELDDCFLLDAYLLIVLLF